MVGSAPSYSQLTSLNALNHLRIGAGATLGGDAVGQLRDFSRLANTGKLTSIGLRYLAGGVPLACAAADDFYYGSHWLTNARKPPKGAASGDRSQNQTISLAILDFGLKEFLGSCPSPCGRSQSKIVNAKLKSSSPVPLWAGSIQNRQSKIQNRLTG